MEVEYRSDAEADRILVRCADPALSLALVELYFRNEGDAYVKRFPPGSVTDEMLDRFRAALLPLLRQAARLDSVPWARALHEAAGRLDRASVDWWLAGSGALAVRGLQVGPRDLDLVVSEDHALRASAALEDVLIEPSVAAAWPVSRWFGRAWLGARVEWVAGVYATVDQPFPTDFGPAAAASLDLVEWEGFAVRVPSLELQRDVSAQRGLTDRVALIDALRGHS